jgi:hypothetical protein
MSTETRHEAIHKWMASIQSAQRGLADFYMFLWHHLDGATDEQFMAAVDDLAQHGLEGWADANELGLDDLRAVITEGEAATFEMAVTSGLSEMRVVKGPSVRERIEAWVTAQHRAPTVEALADFRQGLEADMAPEPLADLEAPAVLFLADICEALGLTEKERAAVLGTDGQAALLQLAGQRYQLTEKEPNK